MSNKRDSSHLWELRAGVAEDIIARAQQDLVFTMKFLGESQYRMLQHFHEFITAELSRNGVEQDDNPSVKVFIDTHAAELREFVFAGVSLTRQFRIQEIEEMLGDTTNLFRTDVWDALSNHIKTAEDQFRRQAKDIPALIDQMAVEAKQREE